MATPESLVKALATGLIEALLATKDEKPAKPKVVKTDDVKNAIREVLPRLLEQMAAEPEQTDLFAPPGGDYGEDIARRVEEARLRSDGYSDEMPPGYFDANLPGAKAWTGPNQT